MRRGTMGEGRKTQRDRRTHGGTERKSSLRSDEEVTSGKRGAYQPREKTENERVCNCEGEKKRPIGNRDGS